MENSEILEKLLYLESYREDLNQIIETCYLSIEDAIYFLERSNELENLGEMNGKNYLTMVCDLANKDCSRNEIEEKINNNEKFN